MRFSSVVSLSLSVLALAAPTPVTKKSDISIAASDSPVGYASQNGGTSGGAGGSAISVSSLSELQAAVTGDKASIITITSSIKGSGDNVKIGSNKSVVGKDSSVVLENFTLTVKGSKNGT